MKIVTVARKPIQGPATQNVIDHGCGALNIDGCRISGKVPVCTGQGFRTGKYGGTIGHGDTTLDGQRWENTGGRWPANLILQHLEGCRCDGIKSVSVSGSGNVPNKSLSAPGLNTYGDWKRTSFASHKDKDGKETIANWICADGCPVAELDNQSGYLKTGKIASHSDRGMWSSGADIDYADQEDGGGASRFFKQVKE
jgi:hypothetical protein